MKVMSYAIRPKKVYLLFAIPSFSVGGFVLVLVFFKLRYSPESLAQVSGNGIHWPV